MQTAKSEPSMVTDFHTHLLPGVDDGSHDLPQSLDMLRLMKEQGITRAVATPHFYAMEDDPDRFLKRREQALEALLPNLEPDMPRIIPGAEIAYFEGISDCDALEHLTVGDTGYLLIEMPGAPWTPRMYRELQDIWHKRGLTPIIAHMDRYISPLRTFGIPEALSQLPVVIQANSSFFLRRMTRSMAMKLLRNGQIHLLGSDCHNTSTRSPNLGDAVKQIQRSLGEQGLETVRSWEAKIFTP